MVDTSHPGFRATAIEIAQRQGIPLSHAEAMLAYSGRHASAAARRKNPRLNRIKGRKK